MRDENRPIATTEPPRRPVWWRRGRPLAGRAARLAGVLATTLVAILLYTRLFPTPTPLTVAEFDSRIGSVMASATPAPPTSQLVYQSILPSLVFIQREGTGPVGDEGVGLGSGVVVNEAGEILTALHVVEGANEIEVIFADGSHATATIATTDPANDIAVLTPSRPPEVIVPATLASARSLRIGDEAYAVGNPLGLAGSLSAGVISGLDRSFTVEQGEQRMAGLIQFDAAVNPGNSGGPLLNRAGHVVGIVTALVNPNDQNSFSGIGFAVPISTAAAAAGGPSY